MNKKHLTLLLVALLLFVGCNKNTKENEVVETTVETTTETTDTNQEVSYGALETTANREEYTDTNDGTHAIEADGSQSSYTAIIVNKSGDSDSENADFYGENAAVFATNGATLDISDAIINTDGKHANAVFSYGENTTLTISNSTIRTTNNNSGGLMLTGGATLIANDLDVITQGNSSAAIRSDRGGGTMVVSGGYYESNGKGSPAIYSTADITVNDAQLVSNSAQGIVVEGKNSVTLNNVYLTANNVSKNSDKSDKYQAIMIYQSMSGDAQVGNANFNMTNGTLENLNGSIFFVNNTTATINLENVTIINEGDFMNIEAAGWGKSGSNGGHVTLNLTKQTIDGLITVDEISSLDLTLTNSQYNGQIESQGEVNVTLSADSTWTLTGDSYISYLDADSSSINLNGYKLYVNGVEYTK